MSPARCRRRRGSRGRRARRCRRRRRRDSSVSARAGMIASSSGAAASSSVSLTESRYESVATMTSFPASKRTRIPVSTGRDSSREAERATRSMVSSSASRSIACSWASTAGRRGKSSALKTCRRELYEPETICTVPSSGRYSIVTSLSGSRRASSTSGLPGMTTAPSPSTCASSVVRSDSSMSVAASVSTSPSARSRIPESTCTVPRVETARETIPSLATSSSRATLIFIPVPVAISAIVSSPSRRRPVLRRLCLHRFFKSSRRSHRECGRRGRRSDSAPRAGLRGGVDAVEKTRLSTGSSAFCKVPTEITRLA